jgi:hypothetical protein
MEKPSVEPYRPSWCKLKNVMLVFPVSVRSAPDDRTCEEEHRISRGPADLSHRHDIKIGEIEGTASCGATSGRIGIPALLHDGATHCRNRAAAIVSPQNRVFLVQSGIFLAEVSSLQEKV